MAKLKINILGARALQDKEAERLIRRAARAAWDSFEYPFGGSVDVMLTDNEGIRDLNNEFRQVDSATDVLSFPMNEFSEGRPPEDVVFSMDPETGLLPLGDMIISVEKAKEQGEEFGHGFERECAYLTVHSMLHLLGYDHVDEGEQKRRMREREETTMALLGLERK